MPRTNLKDDLMIVDMQQRIQDRENLEKQEKEKAEQKARAERMRQEHERWEKMEREAAEARQRAVAEARQREAAERQVQEQRREEAFKRQKDVLNNLRQRQNNTTFHDSAQRNTPRLAHQPVGTTAGVTRSRAARRARSATIFGPIC